MFVGAIPTPFKNRFSECIHVVCAVSAQPPRFEHCDLAFTHRVSVILPSAPLPHWVLQMENSHIISSFSAFCFASSAHCAALSCVYCAGPALKIELLISSWLFCSDHCSTLGALQKCGLFLRRDPCERQMFHLCVVRIQL